MYSLISGFISISFFAFTISQLGTFQKNFKSRQREYNEAMKYINQETCTNVRVKAELGRFNLCTEAEQRLDTPPLIAAIVDTAEGLHLCGNGYCELLGHNITSSLPQIILSLGILALLVLWVAGDQCRRNRTIRGEQFWSLPGSAKTR